MADWLYMETKQREQRMLLLARINTFRRWFWPTVAIILTMTIVAVSAPDVDGELVAMHTEVHK